MVATKGLEMAVLLVFVVAAEKVGWWELSLAAWLDTKMAAQTAEGLDWPKVGHLAG
jgi:hypothetical protein